MIEVVYVTIGDPAFCLALYLSGVPFRGKLQLGYYVGEQKVKFKPMSSRNAWSLIVRRTKCVYIYQNTCFPRPVFSRLSTESMIQGITRVRENNQFFF